MHLTAASSTRSRVTSPRGRRALLRAAARDEEDAGDPARALTPIPPEAAAKFINDSGGLAGGRKIQIDFIDSKLSADEARTALVRACQEDFAIVGTSALFMNNIEPMTSCPDQAGKVTGLPDVPVLQTEIAHQCSPISYPVIVVGLDCKTKDAAEKQVQVRTGAAKYYTKHNKGLHAIFTP